MRIRSTKSSSSSAAPSFVVVCCWCRFSRWEVARVGSWMTLQQFFWIFEQNTILFQFLCIKFYAIILIVLSHYNVWQCITHSSLWNWELGAEIDDIGQVWAVSGERITCVESRMHFHRSQCDRMGRNAFHKLLWMTLKCIFIFLHNDDDDTNNDIQPFIQMLQVNYILHAIRSHHAVKQVRYDMHMYCQYTK